jgi:acetate kinase
MFEAEMKILVCNAGSSSLKFSLFEAEEELLLAEGGVDWSRKVHRPVRRRYARDHRLEMGGTCQGG